MDMMTDHDNVLALKENCNERLLTLTEALDMSLA